MIFVLLICVTMSTIEAAMNNYASSCSNGIDYLTTPNGNDDANKAVFNVLKSKNGFSLAIFGVEVLATKKIEVNVQFNSATVSTQLKPTENRQTPFVLYFNATSVCVFFENDCSLKCSPLPDIVTTTKAPHTKSPTTTKTITITKTKTSTPKTKYPTTTKKTTPATNPATNPTTTQTTTAAGSCCAGNWQQCGGIGYNGPTVCGPGLRCIFSGPYWSQCGV